VALARGDREIGSRRIADEERVARQHELAVDDERAMFGPVPRCVQDADLGRACAHDLAVSECVAGVLGLGERVNRDREVVLDREPAVPGHVVGVRVRLEHALDPHLLLRRRLDVLLDCERRVDNHRDACVTVSDQVRGAPEVVVDELPKDEHGHASLVRQAAGGGRSHT
jgi:hypothetical protein